MKNRRILVATDLTPASLPAFHEAVRIALGNGADLILAHAYEIPGAGSVLVSPETYDEVDQKIRTDVEQRLSALVLEARLLLYGDPYEAIENAATEQDVDLVIMGTHGRTGVSRFFLGSVASRLIATSPCPVLTVRAAFSMLARLFYARMVFAFGRWPLMMTYRLAPFKSSAGKFSICAISHVKKNGTDVPPSTCISS